MSTIKSSAENLTLNADGANNDIIFQSNGSNVATLDQAGLLTATTFAGSGASLTALNGTQVTSGTVPAARMPTGSVLQVVNANISAQVVITSTSPTDVGLSASITPSSTSSKIMVIATATVTCNNNADGSGAIGWSITDSSNNNIIGSAGDANPFDLGHHNVSNWYSVNGVQTKTILHSPSTTSSFTYKMRGENGTASNATFNYNGSYGAISSITLMEIAG